MIANVFDLRVSAQSGILAVLQNFFQQTPVLLLLSSGINETRVRRRVLRFKFFHRVEIGGIGHDLGKVLQLLELIELRFFLFSDSSAHNSSLSSGRTRKRVQSMAKRTPRSQIDNDKSWPQIECGRGP